jgi:hypothetical protein
VARGSDPGARDVDLVATAAVVPSLISEWRILPADASWLTLAVQLGFVTGAVFSAAVTSRAARSGTP